MYFEIKVGELRDVWENNAEENSKTCDTPNLSGNYMTSYLTW